MSCNACFYMACKMFLRSMLSNQDLTGEMARWFQYLHLLQRILSSVPGTHVWWPKSTRCNSRSGEIKLFWLYRDIVSQKQNKTAKELIITTKKKVLLKTLNKNLSHYELN